jgi:hypothetical protein
MEPWLRSAPLFQADNFPPRASREIEHSRVTDDVKKHSSIHTLLAIW